MVGKIVFNCIWCISGLRLCSCGCFGRFLFAKGSDSNNLWLYKLKVEGAFGSKYLLNQAM